MTKGERRCQRGGGDREGDVEETEEEERGSNSSRSWMQGLNISAMLNHITWSLFFFDSSLLSRRDELRFRLIKSKGRIGKERPGTPWTSHMFVTGQPFTLTFTARVNLE